ncbi:MAG TPA: RES family NAD+ phosphorylase [Bryobacteraceae bacterium]|nr:RES family NAD+ phosphorylase [Bryobacteraceae bacterium]
MSTAFQLESCQNLQASFFRAEREGARIYGARWNSPGVPAVYLATSQSLALLEVLVHVGDVDEFLHIEFVCVTVNVPDQIIRLESPWWSSSSRSTWASKPLTETRLVGDAWLNQYSNLVLAVPSVIVPDENNLLLHPSLAESRTVALEKVSAFSLDPRLLRRL